MTKAVWGKIRDYLYSKIPGLKEAFKNVKF